MRDQLHATLPRPARTNARPALRRRLGTPPGASQGPSATPFRMRHDVVPNLRMSSPVEFPFI
jgi:hypothetical protein